MHDWPEQWRKLLTQLPPLGSARVRWGMAGLVLVALLGLVAWPREQEVALFPGASRPAAELRTTLAHLKKSGLTEARLRNGQLFVPASQLTDAQAALQALATANPAPTRSVDSSPIGSFWPTTESQRQEQLDSQRAAELVEMFQSDPNVATAKLVWNRNRRRSFGQEQRTTVVLGVTPRAGREVSHELAESFQMAIVSAFGLAGPEDVTFLVNGPDGARWVRGEADETPDPANRSLGGNRRELAAEGDARGDLFRQPSRGNAARRTRPQATAAARVTHANAEVEEVETAEPRRAPPETFEPPAPQGLPINPAAQLQQELSQQLAWIPGVRIRVDRVSTSLSPHVARRPSRGGPAGSPSGVKPTSLMSDANPPGDRRPYEVVVEVPAKVTRTLAPLRRTGAPADGSSKPAPTRAEVSARVEQIVHRLSPTTESGEPVETSVLVLFSEPVDSGFPGLGWLIPRGGNLGSSTGWPAWGALGVALLGLPAWVWRRRRRHAAEKLPPRSPRRSDRAEAEAGAGAERLSRERSARDRNRQDRDDLPEEISLAAQLLNAEVPAAVTQFATSPASAGAASAFGPSATAATTPVPAVATPTPPPRSAPPVTPPPSTASPAGAGPFASPAPPVPLEPRATPSLPWAIEATGERPATWQGEAVEGQREFRMLDDCTADEWRLLLTEETPQSIACVVARLSAAQATFVLRLLPATTRLDVIRRLAGLELPSPTILREFGLALAERLHAIRTAQAPPATRAPAHTVPTPPVSASTIPAPALPTSRLSVGTPAAALLPRAGTSPAVASPAVGGPPSTGPAAPQSPSAVAPDAALASPSGQFPALSNPASASEEAAPAIPPTPFIELRMLDDGSLRELYVMFDPQVWSIALSGAPRVLTEKLLGSLPPTAAAELQATLARLGATDSAAMEAAQREIEQRLAPLRWRGRRSVRGPRRGARP